MRRPDEIEQDSFLPYRHGKRSDSSLGQNPDTRTVRKDPVRLSASQVSLSLNASLMINKEKGNTPTGSSSAVNNPYVSMHKDRQPSGERSLAMLRVLAVGLAVSLGGPVAAMEIGRAHLASAPGQPLRLTIPLRDLTPQEIQSLSVRVANEQQWAQAGLTPPVPLSGLSARVIEGPEPNSRVIEIRANSAPASNVVDLLIDVNSATTQRLVQSSVISRAAPPVRLAGQTYDVMRGDTLIDITQQFPVSGATLYQSLWALYQANPRAFISENMNLLRAGVSLTIPSAAQVLAVDARLARQQYLAHVRAFNASRGRPGTQVIPAAPGTATQAAQAEESGTSGQVEQAPPQAPTPPVTDRVRLSSVDPATSGNNGSASGSNGSGGGSGSGSGGGSGNGSATASVNVAADQKRSQELARQEEQSRTEALERNIEALKGAIAAAGTLTGTANAQPTTATNDAQRQAVQGTTNTSGNGAGSTAEGQRKSQTDPSSTDAYTQQTNGQASNASNGQTQTQSAGGVSTEPANDQSASQSGTQPGNQTADQAAAQRPGQSTTQTGAATRTATGTATGTASGTATGNGNSDKSGVTNGSVTGTSGGSNGGSSSGGVNGSVNGSINDSINDNINGTDRVTQTGTATGSGPGTVQGAGVNGNGPSASGAQTSNGQASDAQTRQTSQGEAGTGGVQGSTDASARRESQTNGSIAAESGSTDAANGSTEASTGDNQSTAAGADSASAGGAGTNGAAGLNGQDGQSALENSDSPVDQVRQWISDNTLAAGALILALFALIFAWIMRSSAVRENTPRDTPSTPELPPLGASPQAKAFENKLKEISLDLNDPPTDEAITTSKVSESTTPASTDAAGEASSKGASASSKASRTSGNRSKGKGRSR